MADAVGLFVAQLTVNDGTVDSAPDTVTITVTPPPNRPPVGNGDSYKTNEGVTLIVGAPGVLGNDSDPDGNPMSVALLSNAAHGTLVLNADGSFTYTPVMHYHGVDIFTYKANDSWLDSDATTVTINVQEVNQAPSITSTPVTVATVTQPYTYDGDATDPDGDVLSFSLLTAPDGMSIDPATGLIQWTPSAGQAGAYQVVVRAQDPGALFAEQSFAVVVSSPPPVNQAPVITSTAVTAATAGQIYNYTVTAGDPDAGDMLTFSLTSAPDGMAIGASTGVISWMPGEAQAGSHEVTVRVTDSGGLFAEQSFTIVVSTSSPDNEPPVITSEPNFSQWTKLNTTGDLPTPRYAGSILSYDEMNDRLIVFGGQVGSTSHVNDVWVLSQASEFEGNPSWAKLNPVGSAPRPRSQFISLE